MRYKFSKPDPVSNYLSLGPKMPWHEAFRVMHMLIHGETTRLEQNAKWHDDQNEEADYSHKEAARIDRNKANQIREAFEVMARGY